MLKLNSFKVGADVDVNFGYRHPEYEAMYANWTKNRDFVRGTDYVKTRTYSDLYRYNDEGGLMSSAFNNTDQWEGTAYLPVPKGMMNEPELYRSYKDRAQLYNASGSSVESYKGMLYRKSPVFQYEKKSDAKDADSIDLAELEDKIKNKVLKKVTSDNRSFIDLCVQVSEEVIITNKVGILVDFPSIQRDKELSVLEYEELNLTPKTSVYNAESIVNWHTIKVDDEIIPDYFVLDESTNEFDVESMQYKWVERYRVLYLEDNGGDFVYRQLVVENKVKGNKVFSGQHNKGKYTVVDSVTPMKEGVELNRIPFYVIDKDGLNYTRTSESIINDLVDVNIGHYRNSADWEHNLYYLGMKTLVVKGYSVEDNGPITVGGVISAKGSNFEANLLEPTSDSGIEKEMQNKELRMSVLGSQSISQRGKYVQSAATAKINSATEDSILGALANAQSVVMSIILNLILDWSGYNAIKGSIQINTDYYNDTITPESIIAWTQLKQAGGISEETWYYNLDKRDVFPPDWSLDKELTKIEEGRLDIANDLIYKNTPMQRPDAVEEDFQDIGREGRRKFESKPDPDEDADKQDPQEYTL
jgi:hypothetical protein